MFVVTVADKAGAQSEYLHQLARDLRDGGAPSFMLHCRVEDAAHSRAMSAKFDLPSAVQSDIKTDDIVIVPNAASYLIPRFTALHVGILWLKPELYFDSLRLWQEFAAAAPADGPRVRRPVRDLVRDDRARTVLRDFGVSDPVVLADRSGGDFGLRVRDVFSA